MCVSRTVPAQLVVSVSCNSNEVVVRLLALCGCSCDKRTQTVPRARFAQLGWITPREDDSVMALAPGIKRTSTLGQSPLALAYREWSYSIGCFGFKSKTGQKCRKAPLLLSSSSFPFLCAGALPYSKSRTEWIFSSSSCLSTSTCRHARHPIGDASY